MGAICNNVNGGEFKDAVRGARRAKNQADQAQKNAEKGKEKIQKGAD